MAGMAKKLEKLPPQFEELEKALEDPEHPGWSIGSAEGGWATPTKEEWGKRPKDAPASPSKQDQG